jgi:leucyl aminopeptidase
MQIKISRENIAYWQKKGALAFVFEKEGKDGVFVERSGKSAMTIAVDLDKMTRRKLILLVRRTVREAMVKKYASIVLDLEQFRFPKLEMGDRDVAELVATNLVMAEFEFRDFLSVPKEGWSEVKTVALINASGKDVRQGVERGTVIGEETNRARHIANMPGGEMTPEILARHAKQSVKGLPVKCRVLDEAAMKRLKMGGVLGVGKGSEAKPCFIVLEYHGASDKKAKLARHGSQAKRSDSGGPVVLVGKGVTFDTGGLNLKPEGSILGMNMDMSGGAAVIHAIAAAARLKMKKNIIVLIPAAENMPSGSSYRPGDVIRSMSGKTIEVANTDAEGRIILADALHYAKRYRPSLVVDVATLTGAALVALGERATALFTQDEKLEKAFRDLGEESGDHVWPLPLWDEYDAEIKGAVGDVANLGKTRWGGAITAAAFLKQFVDDAYRWVHLDIAPRMTALPDEFLGKGAAGAPVRLLVKVLEKF